METKQHDITRRGVVISDTVAAFVQDQMAVICLVEVASCPSRGDGPLGSA